MKIARPGLWFRTLHTFSLIHFTTRRHLSVPLRMAIPPSAYPLANRDASVVHDYFGTKVPDPYNSLEDPEAEETKSFVEAVNVISSPFLKACPIRDVVNKRLTELWDFPKYSCPSRHGEKYFYSHNSGLQNQYVMYVQDDVKDEGRVFLDPNKLSDDGTVSLAAKSFTEDGTLFGYGLSEKGSDWVTLKFKDVATGNDLPDVLHKVKFSGVQWTIDNKGIFYNMYPAAAKAEGTSTDLHEFHSLYYHRLGTEQTDDPRCVHFPDHAEYMVGGEVTEDGDYLIVEASKGCDPTNLLYYYDLANNPIQEDIAIIPIVDTLKSKYDFICNQGSTFLVMTNENAPMFKLIKIQLDGDGGQNHAITEFVAEDPNAKLDWATCVGGDKVVLCYMKDVKNEIQVHDLNTGKLLYKLPLDIGTVTGFSGSKKHSEVFYRFESFLSPGMIYRFDVAKPDVEPELLREIKVTGFEPGLFETNQIFYESNDGTKVPMFLVHKKGILMNSENPALLYSYGGFNIALQPYFSVSRLLFLRHFNGVFALANIRGGCEYGEKWHEGGMLFNKQNVFDDFISAARYLIDNKYTATERLAIQGGSNGGLLMGAVSNQAPNLFGAVVNQCGVLDMLRFQKFTIGKAWAPEFGSSDDKDQFEYIHKYSPLHNLKTPMLPNEEYPPTLLLTADHDDRVVPLHSLKYMAELYHKVRESPVQKNPLLIRVETKAGHGAGKPTSKIIEELTDIYSFLIRILKLKWVD